ncbi:NADP-dependent oxidoreductase [Cohnella cholangitidis]|uniref:NADP-dependent oxidoreductase n=1 Tax=Cohnella cholangitidis TaxID=2598458 RepID=A0A7G5C0L1_9BACL|nr:NADP-dependent oxidoreductase [Cohnella cholangitidis]QMV42745.1 NADP-dependent oxidoreductase [Cohnella cholangitidis]
MKAAAFTSYGPPDVLKLMDFEAPQADAGQVRVQVKAAGVQPADVSVRTGWVPPGATVSFPQIPGNEFAGVIDQIGEGVGGFAVGDEVLGYRMLNCYAEFVVVSVDQIITKPHGTTWEAAGSLSASGQTAHTALQELRVGKGDTVLIHAAAGGVGSVAVQLARFYGATVIGTASERNHDYLRSLGAIPATYGEGLADRVRSLAPNGVHAALDAAGGDALQASLELVGDKDRIGTIVAFEQAARLGLRVIRSQRSAVRLAQLADLHSRGELQIHIRQTFPLSHAADAHREVEKGHGRGKVVLSIG